MFTDNNLIASVTVYGDHAGDAVVMLVSRDGARVSDVSKQLHVFGECTA